MIRNFVALLFVVLFVACNSSDDTGGTGDGGTPIANPPTRPITTTVTPPDPDEAAVPTLTALAPSSGAVGSLGPTVILTGTGFVPRSVVTVDGVDLDTTYESDTELAATLPDAKLTAVAQLSITVRTPAPGGGTTAALSFAVENPPPALIALDPLSITAGSGDTSITAVGTTFVSGSIVHFGTTDLVTTFTDAQHIVGTIPAALLTTSASVPVSVTTPAPGGGSSTTIAFTISNPDATITSVTPSTVIVGSPDFDIEVIGTGFVSGSVILFNGTALATTPGAAGELEATVPAANVATVGALPITVQNPPPGGGVSAPAVINVNNPVPTLTTLTPASAAAGSGPTPVTVTGTSFVSASKVQVNGISGVTTFVDASHLKVTLTAPQLLNVATLALDVFTSGPGGGTTPKVNFAVVAGTPKITSLDPSTAIIGSADKVITIHGSMFVASSTVTANGNSIASTFANGGQLSATIPAAMLANAGSIAIIVNNGAGGPSNAQPFSVVCDTTNVNVALTDTTTVQTFTTDFAAAPLLSRWTSDGTCPNDTFSPVLTPQPALFAVVQNNTTAPVTLAAWADCSTDPKAAAFLAFYRRATPPATDADRMVCEGFVTDGPPHASSLSGTSTSCPGLTKENGGGISLGVCERAVVSIQAFDSASASVDAPATLKIQAEQ